jgi:hypothetical protein
MAKKQVNKAKKQPTKEIKQSTLENLTLADGKAKIDSDIERVKELEDILGIKKMNPFGTSNIEVFKEKLNDMTILDMQNMCEKIGIFASGSRLDLKEKLMRQFKSYTKGSISMTVQNPAFQLDPNNPEHQKTLKLLREL